MSKVLIMGNTGYHYSYIEVLLEIFAKDDVTLILTFEDQEYLAASVKHHGNIKVIPSDAKCVFSIKHIQYVREADLVIMDNSSSVSSLLSLLFYPLNDKIYFTVHDWNSWFEPKWTSNLRVLITVLLKTYIRNRLINFVVIASNLKEYLAKKYPDVNIIYVPFRYTSLEKMPPVNCEKVTGATRLKVVVPGNVAHKRQYKELIHELEVSGVIYKIDLHLLGRASGQYAEDIITLCDQLNSQGATITYYRDHIERNLFEKIICSSDLLLSVFELEYYDPNHAACEVWGKTKESNLPFLMLSFAKCAIVPVGYNVMKEVRSQVFYYQSLKDVSQILIKILDKELSLYLYNNKACQNNKKIDLISFRKQFALTSLDEIFI